MQNIKKYILTQLRDGSMDKDEAVSLLQEIQDSSNHKIKDIAIIGLSARLPMADSADEYWDNLVHGRRCFTSKPASKLRIEKVMQNPYYAEFLNQDVPTNIDDLEGVLGAYVSDMDRFDYHFFNIAPHEASYIEPGQRIFMEIAWGAIEDAGYGIDQVRDSKMGVFVGKDHSNSMYYKEISKEDSSAITGNWDGYLASRISYAFNFQGPAMVVDTACSSGLVAVHEACTSLRNEECDFAIAGGIFVGGGGSKIGEEEEDGGQDTGSIGAVSSKDNNVRTFDRKTTGSVFGEGVVAFLLKPLEAALKDRDHIYAVIKGSAINNDGASNGITAPNPISQQTVIEEAWKRAGISPEEVNYVEAHGTGTLLGDPIEVLGLTKAFANHTDRKQFCGIGSVKTNVGHLVAASGPASLLKVILALENEIIPPSLNFEEPNQNIDFVKSPLFVVDKLIPWKRSNQERVAGINAFGFSGTNCHMIVADAPKQESDRSTHHQENLVTISGKTEAALHNLIKAYEKYLQQDLSCSIDDLCFTANVGRGHYAYRAALVVKDKEDFANKIRLLIEQNFDATEIEDVFLARHLVISSKSSNREEGNVTEEELHDLFVQAQDKIDSYKEGLPNTKELLIDIAQAYVRGAKIDFQAFYAGETHFRVALPTYRFDRTICWAEPKITKITDNRIQIGEKKYPVIERKLVDSIDTTIYEAHFSTEKHWFLKEHRLMGSNIVPGTAYIEMMLEIVKEYWDVEQVVVKSLVFSHPLEAAAEPVATQFVITHQENDLLIRVATREAEGEGNWIVHAEARVGQLKDSPQAAFDVENIANCAEDVTIQMPETKDTDDYVYMGPRWHSVLHTYRKENVLESEIQLKAEYWKDIEEYRYHPALSDAALNIPLQIYVKGEMYLPLSYRNLKIYGRIPSHFFSRLEKTAGDIGSEILSFRVTLADTEGKILAEIDNYTTKKVGKFNNYVANAYHGFVWVPYQDLPVYNSEAVSIQGNTIVFEDEHGRAREVIQQLGKNVKPFYIRFGEQNKQIDSNTYQIDGSEESYDRLLETLNLSSLEHVFQMANFNDDREDTFEGDSTALQRSLYNLFFFPRAILRHLKGKTHFHLITTQAYCVKDQELVNPFHTSFLAMVKTLAAEYTNYVFDAYDFDANVGVEEVLAAIQAETPYLINAVRDGKLYHEEMTILSTSHLEARELKIRKEGVYVITGGTGGLGRELAKYLAETGAGTICLLARRAIPERDQFETILEKNRNKRLVKIIHAIQTMEELGATVDIRQADVSDEETMKHTLDALRNQYGCINGVIHCAGVAGDGFLYNKSLDTFNSVIQPKIFGINNILRGLADCSPDFIVLFSSMQTAFGGPGQGDYTAANAYLDGLGEKLRLKNMNVQTINWPGWSETGMAVDYGISDAMTLFRSISTHKALVAFDYILHHDISNIIPGEINYEFLTHAQEGLFFTLSERIQKKLKYYREHLGQEKEDKARRYNPEELVIIGNTKTDYSETEKTVAHVYASILDLSEIDVFENFNALGGDSILAAEVLKQLNLQFDNILTIADMYMYPTVDDMTKHIEEVKTGRSENMEGTKVGE